MCKRRRNENNEKGTKEMKNEELKTGCLTGKLEFLS
jgi:hypothetical protein